jgi:hypothetical protein
VLHDWVHTIVCSIYPCPPSHRNWMIPPPFSCHYCRAKGYPLLNPTKGSHPIRDRIGNWLMWKVCILSLSLCFIVGEPTCPLIFFLPLSNHGLVWAGSPRPEESVHLTVISMLSIISLPIFIFSNQRKGSLTANHLLGHLPGIWNAGLPACTLQPVSLPLTWKQFFPYPVIMQPRLAPQS